MINQSKEIALRFGESLLQSNRQPDMILDIYRASWMELPEVGEMVGVTMRTQHGDAELVGEVWRVDPINHRFDVKLSRSDAHLISSIRVVAEGSPRPFVMPLIIHDNLSPILEEVQ